MLDGTPISRNLTPDGAELQKLAAQAQQRRAADDQVKYLKVEKKHTEEFEVSRPDNSEIDDRSAISEYAGKQTSAFDPHLPTNPFSMQVK